MDSTKEYAMELTRMSDTELLKRRADIFDSLIAKGIDGDVLVELCSITITLALRGF